MRVIDPNKANTKTLTGRLSASMARVLPTRDNFVDAGMLSALILIGILGFRWTFDSWYFMVVGVIGVVLGLLIAHIVTSLRWHWLIGVLIAFVVYLLLGGAVALHQDAIGGVIPTVATFLGLMGMMIDGWKSLLTTLPPVAGSGPFLVLPYLLALAFTTLGYMVVRLKKSPRLAMVAPVILFVLVIALGTAEKPAMLLVQGIGFGVIGLVWMTIRTNRRRSLVGTGTTRLSTVLTGIALVVVCSVVAGFVGPMMPGIDPPRQVLRSYVVPPIDVSQYPSPLPGLRKFSSEGLRQAYDKPLMEIQGASAGDYVRFSVLDAYNGLVWSANSTLPGAGFFRMGSQIPLNQNGPAFSTTITIDQAYAQYAELNVWVPNLGPASTLSFGGPDARALTDSVYYDLSKGEALTQSRLNVGDTITMTGNAIPVYVVGSEALEPAGTRLVSNEQTQFMDAPLQTLDGGTIELWKQILAVCDSFKNGRWSDGTAPGEAIYLPGHGRARLYTFMTTGGDNKFVGSDEHYSAAFALAANRLGFPARVVFGAKVPSGEASASGVTIQGKDVTAWVELNTTQGWIALPTTMYIPDRDRSPDQSQSPPQANPPPEVVPPPNPVDPSGETGSNTDTDTKVIPRTCEETGTCPTPWTESLITVGIYVGIGFAALLVLLVLLVVIKVVRALVRRSMGSNVRKVAAGWVDALDRARDAGKAIPPGLTRKEQAAALGLTGLADLAPNADQAMFGPYPPDGPVVQEYWKSVSAAKKAILKSHGFIRRLWIRVNPRSLVPLSAKSLGLSQAQIGSKGRAVPRLVQAVPAGRHSA